jgi:hypothetical protein
MIVVVIVATLVLVSVQKLVKLVSPLELLSIMTTPVVDVVCLLSVPRVSFLGENNCPMS